MSRIRFNLELITDRSDFAIENGWVDRDGLTTEGRQELGAALEDLGILIVGPVT